MMLDVITIVEEEEIVEAAVVADGAVGMLVMTLQKTEGQPD